MKLKTEIFFDRTIIGPFLLCLNWIVRLAGKILRLDHNLNREFKKIAICKFKGLGSIIQSTPLLQTLRRRYPDVKIIFVSTKVNKDMLNSVTCIDELVLLDDSSLISLLFSFPALLVKLILLRIEVYIDLEIYSNFSSFVTTASLAQNRLGFYLRSSHYRLGIYTHMMYFNTRVPIYQTYMQIARLLGCRNLVESLFPFKDVITSEAIKRVQDYLGSSLKDTSYIVINVNASDLRIERRWPSFYYIKLIESLREKYPDIIIVLIGNLNERDYVESLLKKISMKQGIINVAGQTGIIDLLALLSEASVFITNDSGPMHMAFSLKTKSVVLFGPCHPGQYGFAQGQSNIYILYNRVYCSPCVHEFFEAPCKGNNQCMQMISVEQVLAGVKHFLKPDSRLPHRSTDKNKIVYFSNGVLGQVNRIG